MDVRSVKKKRETENKLGRRNNEENGIRQLADNMWQVREE